MAKRLTLLYRFSTDNGATWTDFTEQVDSLQTTITDNLCTNNFTSAKDEAQFTMPETSLFDGQGNPTPKKLLMDALLGTNDILIHINAPYARKQVVWDDDDVMWNSNHVKWSGTSRRFTGYADRSSIDLRSYPLPPMLTVKVQDVSTLHLDDKVGYHICWENYSIKQIVRSLLSLAGYDPTDVSLSDADHSVMSTIDNVSLEAFVIDKDNAKSYREYIDTILFEAGGYVINFDEYGKPILVHLQWDGNAPAQRVIDNPLNSSGVTMRSSYLKEDGAKLTWSTLEWSAPGERIWQSGISQSIENGELVGEIVHAGRYWPDGAEITPQFFQYDAKLLDSAYLTRESRKQNEDLTIIMAKDVYARADSMQNGAVFDGWDYLIPTSPTDFTQEPYNLTTNPTIWPTKAWWLLHNPTNDDVNLTFFTIYGTVLYRKTRNTLQTMNSKNPKEYESTYIYDANQARRFLAFWWHFIQTSRYLFTWTDINEAEGLNDIVAVGIKGNGSMQKSLVVGKTSKWINNDHEVVTFSSVGIESYTPQSFIPLTIAPSSTTSTQTTKTAVTATFQTTPSKTMSEWEALGTPGATQTWTVTNASAFKAGDVALINGTISDLNGTPVSLFIDVTSVNTTAGTISGMGIRIRYAGSEGWDFNMSRYSVSVNHRKPTSYVDIALTSTANGQGGITPYWTCTGSHTHFTPGAAQTATGNVATLRVWLDETMSSVTVTMYESSSLENPVAKTLEILDETNYNFDFGAWTAPTLPTYIDQTNTEEVIDGDYFVVGSGGFVGDDGQTYTEGVPYIYDHTRTYPWHNEMQATDENSERLLQCLSHVLSDENIQPSTSALYAWFGNLISKNAVIDNLTSNMAFIEDLRGTSALFENIEITGNSKFKGVVQTTAFTTTLASGGGPQYNLGLNTSTRYWGYNNLAAKLNNLLPSAGYYSTTGTYPQVRRGTGNLLIKSLMSGPGQLPAGTTLFTSTRSQRVTLKFETSSTAAGRFTCDGQTYTIAVGQSGTPSSVTFNVSVGSVIKVSSNAQAYMIGSGNLSLYDIGTDFSKEYTFFNSSGNAVSVSNYQSGYVTIGYNGSSVTSDALYKWGGMSTASGSGQADSSQTRTFSITNDMGTVIANSRTIQSVYWSSASSIDILDTSLQTFTVNTSTYYQVFTATFKLLSSIDSVQTATITPKNNSCGVGTSDSPFYEAWIKNLHYQTSSQFSARKFKDNIRPFDKDALDLLKGTDIVFYNYKNDDKEEQKIGFIADDTPSELSGKNHDSMVHDNCIAVLIKAVQELSEKVEKLEKMR